jgi:hypothetical protein
MNDRSRPIATIVERGITAAQADAIADHAARLGWDWDALDVTVREHGLGWRWLDLDAEDADTLVSLLAQRRTP